MQSATKRMPNPPKAEGQRVEVGGPSLFVFSYDRFSLSFRLRATCFYRKLPSLQLFYSSSTESPNDRERLRLKEGPSLFIIEIPQKLSVAYEQCRKNCPYPTQGGCSLLLLEQDPNGSWSSRLELEERKQYTT
jgi:hypothetical protein